MRNRLNNNELDYRLTQEEFNEMLKDIEKGVIGYKAYRNDNITKMALMMASMFKAQYSTTRNFSQKNVANYQEANDIAKKCVTLMQDFVHKDIKNKKSKRVNKKASAITSIPKKKEEVVEPVMQEQTVAVDESNNSMDGMFGNTN